jgi:2-keto-3-deoxy-L-rhamnonate aldolase RhmA
MTISLRARLQAGELLVGTVVSVTAPEVAEILAGCGFDWLFIDGEHGPLSFHEAQMLLQAAGNCPCLVRVPAGEEAWIKKALDIGADGVIVPQVHTAEQAEQIVRLCKYPPEGNRGVGVARAHGYGARFEDYVTQANEQLAVVVQAESEVAVKNIRAIASIPGIDAVLVGPYDLSASLGRMGQVSHPEVRTAIDTIAENCEAAGVRLGVFGASAEAVQPYIDAGFTLVAVAMDTMFLAQAASEALDNLSRP